MLETPPKRIWPLLLTTILMALLGSGAFFAFFGPGAGPAWLVARRSPGQVAGSPAIRPDLAGAVGVNLGAGELTGPDLDGRLDRLDASGLPWVRLRVPWDQIEPVQGQYRWDTWDGVFAALARHPALTPLIVLDGSPAWARRPGDEANPLAPPQTRAHFGDFAAAVARRYGDQIRYYQVWDEPNIAPHWGARPVDAADYAGLLREAAAQVRAADHGSQIVLAALAPNQEAGGANQSDISFLDTLYNLGGRAWFDIAAAEPYGFDLPPDAPPAPTTLNFSRAALLREVMVRHDDAGTPLWATAFGWNALPRDWTGHSSPWATVDEAQQATYASAALEQARTRWPWLGPLFWAEDCPAVQDGLALDDPRWGFALCRQDRTARPIWQALVDSAADPLVLPPGEHPVDHPALHYGPGWRVTSSAADPAADGDRLTFTFYGTDLALRVQRGPFWAYYRVSVDGQPANALPKDETGAAYLALADPLAETQDVTVARGLAPGVHQAVVEAHGGWDQWALQRVLVAEASPSAVPPTVWAGLAVLGALAWCAAAWPWRRNAAAGLATAVEWAASRPAPLAWGLAALLWLAFWASPGWPLTIALLAALGALFVLRPPLMLPLIAAAIPLWPVPKAILRWQFSSYELLVWTGAAAFAVHSLLSRLDAVPHLRGLGNLEGPRQQPRQDLQGLRNLEGPGQGVDALRHAVASRLGLHGLDWPVLALLAVALAATLNAQRFGVAAREFRNVFFDGAVFYFLVTRVLSGTGMRGVGVKTRVFTPTPLIPVIDGFILGAVFVSLLALWQLGTGQGRIDVEGVWRVRGFYGSPNNLALVLDRAVPLALAVALYGLGAGRARRWAYGLTTVVLGLTCLATFSKGALLLGLPAGIGLVVLAGARRAGRRAPLLALAVAAFLAALALVVLFRTPRFADLTNFQTGTSFIRLKLWQGAWHMALDHPWLGVGPDNFLYAYRTRYVLPSAWEELNLSHPHNILLDMWTRLGLLGLAASGWALAAGIRRAWAHFRHKGGQTWPLALGLLGALAATVTHGLIDNSLFLIDLMAIFMMTLGLLQVITENGD